MTKKDFDTLLSEIQTAQNSVKIGEIYTHYKDRSKFYKVIGYTILEATDEVAVIYKPLYIGKEITFTRPFSVFIESVEWEGRMVKRFKKEEGGER